MSLSLWQSVCVSVNRLIRIWYSHMQQINKSYIELPWQSLMASTVIPLMNYNSESASNITFYRFHTLLLILAILWWSITINQRLRFNHLLYIIEIYNWWSTFRDLLLRFFNVCYASSDLTLISYHQWSVSRYKLLMVFT